jgi:hypothetical protein
MDNPVELLQNKVSMLESELTYLNQILIACGFPEGLSTLRVAAEEVMKTLAQ